MFGYIAAFIIFLALAFVFYKVFWTKEWMPSRDLPDDIPGRD